MLKSINKDNLSSLWKFIIYWTKGYQIYLFIIIVLFSAHMCLHIVNDQIFSDLIDIFSSKQTAFKGVFLWFLLVRVLREFLHYIGKIIRGYIFPKIEMDIRMTVFDHVQKLSLNDLKKFNEGFLESYIDNITEGFRDLFNSFLSTIAPNLIGLFAYIFYVFYLNKYVGFIMIIWMILFFGIWYLRVNGILYFARLSSEYSNIRTGLMIDSFKNFLTKKVFGLERYSTKQLKTTHLKEIKYDIDYMNSGSTTEFILDTIGAIFFGIIVLYLYFKGYLTGTIETNVIVMCMCAAWSTGFLSSTIVNEFVEVMQSIGQFDASFKSLRENIIEEPTGDVIKDSIEWNIEFKKCNYVSNDGTEILKDFSVKIKPQDHISIVGPSGIGKSTLLSMLFKGIAPFENKTIKIDDTYIEDYDNEWLRKHIAVIVQSNMLFNSTIYENLLIGNVHATREEIIEIAKEVGIHELIIELPNGYETQVESCGQRFSGGQIQLFCIARALLKLKTIPKGQGLLLCDEPTSALDSTNEHKIINLIFSYAKKYKSTLVVITHNAPLDLMDKFEKIIVMQPGVYFIDNHKNLIKDNDYYRAMFHLN